MNQNNPFENSVTTNFKRKTNIFEQNGLDKSSQNLKHKRDARFDTPINKETHQNFNQ